MQQLSARSRVSVAGRASRRSCVVVQAKKVANGPRVAIVGVSGAVGQEFLTARENGPPPRWARARAVRAARRAPLSAPPMALFNATVSRFCRRPRSQVMKERNFPYSDLKMLASARCAPAADSRPTAAPPPRRADAATDRIAPPAPNRARSACVPRFFACPIVFPCALNCQ